MQDLWIFHPLGHSSKQDMMAYVVKVALKVYVDDLGKPLHQPMHDPIQCLVCRAPGPVSKGAWIKVRFKDRLQDQLYCPLNNPISDGGNSEPAGLAIPLRNLHPPVLTWLVGAGEEVLLYPFEKLLHSSGLDGLKAYSIKTRCPIVGFRLLIGHP